MRQIKAFVIPILLLASFGAWSSDGMAYEGHSQGMIRRVGEAPAENVTVTPMIGPSAYLDLEVGVKASYRVADREFIPILNNSVAIEGGIFVGPRHIVIEPILRWDFHVHPEWTVYPGLGACFVVDHLKDQGFFPATLTAGAFWRPTGSKWTFRGEIDWALGSLRAGPVFYF